MAVKHLKCCVSALGFFVVGVLLGCGLLGGLRKKLLYVKVPPMSTKKYFKLHTP